MIDAYIFDGLRTPFGRHAGALSPVRPDDLLAAIIQPLISRCSVPLDLIDDVIVGNAGQAGEDGRNVARHALLAAGLAPTVPGLTVNRLCGSGLAAVADAARTISAGQGDLVIAAGVESMSRSPFVFAKNEAPFGRDMRVFDATIGARFPNPRIERLYGADTMPQTAENVAADLRISRDACDRFAEASQRKYAAARGRGFIATELHPVTVPARKTSVTVEQDEHPRPQTTIEQLAKLSSLHEGGVVTAGNASGINDGAVALLLGNWAAGERLGLKPRARIVSAAVAGVEPRVMGLGPVPASQKALDRAGLSLTDMDVIEINEAFAAQVLGCQQLLKLAEDDSRINPNGGAIAVGHPLGASGARLGLTALRQLEAGGGRYALVALCIGVGQGIAMIIERV